MLRRTGLVMTVSFSEGTKRSGAKTPRVAQGPLRVVVVVVTVVWVCEEGKRGWLVGDDG